MTKPRPIDFLVTAQRLKQRNTLLAAQLWRAKESRDKWRKRALECSGEREKTRKRRARWRQKRVTYTADEWRQHALIVARIRSIPNRDILTP